MGKQKCAFPVRPDPEYIPKIFALVIGIITNPSLCQTQTIVLTGTSNVLHLKHQHFVDQYAINARLYQQNV